MFGFNGVGGKGFDLGLFLDVDVDEMRNWEIVVKVVMGILILLLKWLKFFCKFFVGVSIVMIVC